MGAPTTMHSDTESARETKYPLSMRNPMIIRNCVDHETRDWKQSFDWLSHPSTMACEWFNGRNVAFIKSGGMNQVDFGLYTRRSYIDLGTFSGLKDLYSIVSAINDGRILDVESEVPIPGTIMDLSWGEPYFISRQEQMSVYRIHQWESGPRTLSSTEEFLYECSQTCLPIVRANIGKAFEKNHRIYVNGKKTDAYPRPDGIMFWNNELEVFGRIRLEDCLWYQISKNSKLTIQERNKALKTELKRIRS